MEKEVLNLNEENSFPYQVMNGVAGDFAKIHSRYLEPPIEFFYMGYLTCLGSMLADRITLESEIGPQPRLYVATIGQSAFDRKSTAIQKCIDFFKDTFEDFQVCYGVGSAEGLQERIKECEPHSLLIAFDELKSFTSKCKIEASVLLPCVNSLFESNRYESRTKKSSLSLENARISILSASTLETYETMWASQFLDIGFVNRLFIVPGASERKHSIPKKIPLREKDFLKKQTKTIFAWVGDYTELKITPDAEKIFNEWYLNLERSVHSKRVDTYALRFMPLLAANEAKSKIDCDVVTRVISLMNWQLEVRKKYDPIDADNEIVRMENRIRRCLTQPLNNRELKRRCHYDRHGLWVFNAALKNLRGAQEVSLNKKTKLWEMLQ
jgi:hypothetical protein